MLIRPQLSGGALADELKAEGLVFGGELQACSLGLPPLLPAKFNFGREVDFVLQ